MTKAHCKVGSKLVDSWPKQSAPSPRKIGQRQARAWLGDAPAGVVNERFGGSDLTLQIGTLKASTPACQRLKGRLEERIEILHRVRLLESLMRELNKAMCLDQTMTPDIDGYRVFRNGLVPLEVFGNLARYEAHLTREIEANLFLLRPTRERLRTRRRCDRT